MQTVIKLSHRFGALSAQYQLNRSLNAVRFEAQNILWDHEQANYQVQAFAKGLASLKFGAGDNFLLRVPSNQQTEAYVAKVGTSAIGANLILSEGKTQSEVDAEIKNNNIRGIVFEPTLTVGDQLFIDVLNKLIPELSKTKNGEKVKSSNYGSLTTLVQTNFYSYPGVYKFRSILNYASDKYFKLPSEESFDPVTLPFSGNPLFVTQVASDLAFRAGVLNCNINGRFLVVVEPHQVNRIAEIHGNKVDLLATEDISNLNPQINVFVPKGSTLFQGRNNRIEL